MKTSLLLPALLCAALTVTLPAATSDELRAEAEKLIEQAKQAKTEGRADQAQALMERVKGIKEQLRDQLAAVDGAARGEADGARRKIEELRKTGRQDEAAQLERKLAARSIDGTPAAKGPRAGEVPCLTRCSSLLSLCSGWPCPTCGSV